MVFSIGDLGKLLSTNFKTLFMLLDPSSKPDDLIQQLPQSTTDLELAAGATWSYSSTAGRRLIYITVSIPAGVLVEILKDNDVIMWFTNEAGTLQLKNGIQINEYTVRATNSGDTAARWACRMIFA